ncbi:hypothetical protein [Streptomyces sp. NPDC005859]|uniref:hypothetical protein n=1 Tax=Streptomyces sp. NPDC005859 TaxID=3157170 RepID=UPI0033C0489B
MCLLIRAGAHNGGSPRVLAVHLPICRSQAEALEALTGFHCGSDAGTTEVELLLAGPMVDLLQHGPAAAVWRPVRDPEHRVGWLDPQGP